MLRSVAIAGLALAGVVAVLLATVVVLALTGTLKAYQVPSSAMEPTLRCGRPGVGCEGDANDRVLVLTRLVSYERGDLVVFDVPPRAQEMCGAGGKFVKRIVGLPGELLELRQVDGRDHVFVDGEPLEEPYVEDGRRTTSGREAWGIPEGSYFVMGDNRAQSCDSTVWGTLDGALLTGEVVATYWPPDRITIR